MICCKSSAEAVRAASDGRVPNGWAHFYVLSLQLQPMYQCLGIMQEEVEGFVDALLPGAVRLNAAATDAVPSALQALQAGKHVFMEVSH